LPSITDYTSMPPKPQSMNQIPSIKVVCELVPRTESE
jgi:hypothetical protein